jgi:hypothetical protein
MNAIVSGTAPWDNAPGGNRDSMFQMDTTAVPYGDLVALHDWHCFVPTISALALDTTDLFFDVDGTPDLLAHTPFDAVRFASVNEEHIFVGPEEKAWITAEVLAGPTSAPQLASSPRGVAIALQPAFPNPFHDAVTIRFAIGSASKVTWRCSTWPDDAWRACWTASDCSRESTRCSGRRRRRASTTTGCAPGRRRPRGVWRRWTDAGVTREARRSTNARSLLEASTGAWLAALGVIVLFIFADVLFAPHDRVLSREGTDVWRQFAGWRAFGFGTWKTGDFPLWNPFVYGGMPYFTGFQSALLYPPNALFLAAPLAWAINWSIAIHAWWLAAGVCVWLRRSG